MSDEKGKHDSNFGAFSSKRKKSTTPHVAVTTPMCIASGIEYDIDGCMGCMYGSTDHMRNFSPSKLVKARRGRQCVGAGIASVLTKKIVELIVILIPYISC